MKIVLTVILSYTTDLFFLKIIPKRSIFMYMYYFVPVPPPSFVASSIQTVMNHNDTSIWFICKFNHDRNENLVYQVEWHVDGNSEQIVTKQFCNATDMTPCYLQHTDMENINVGMGSNVNTCFKLLCNRIIHTINIVI